MSRARKLTTSGRDRGRPLADFLAERLAVERAAAARLVRDGGVYVGRGRVEDPERQLDAGERVTVHDVQPAGESIGGPAGPLAIVYEDAEVLVVDKPSGVPSQATRERSAGALDRIMLEREPEARLLHRLDREASGLVLFTRTAEAHRRFAEHLRAGRLRRRYLAAVWGDVAQDAARLDRPIGPDPRDRRRMVAGLGRPALTDYRVARRGQAANGAPTTLLEIDLGTGRTHQIRVHLSDAGHPLCGDHLYGPSPPPAEVARLCLHAHQLAWPNVDPILSPAPAAFHDVVAATGTSPRRDTSHRTC